MIEIIAATGNANKVKEFKEILGEEYDVKSLKDVGLKLDIVEDADTFYGNALIKAKAVSKATGKIVLADDSGLIVDALGGAPGVYSARYGGEDGNDVLNRARLLREMGGITDRSARFHASIVLYYPDGTHIHTEGNTEGYILYKEEGNNGFGYDSLFYSTDLNECFAVADSASKNAVSHRGRALKALVEKLNEKQ